MNDPVSKLQVRSKIWVEIDGEPVFGQGREELLRLIHKVNSINAAAKAMGIPLICSAARRSGYQRWQHWRLFRQSPPADSSCRKIVAFVLSIAGFKLLFV